MAKIPIGESTDEKVIKFTLRYDPHPYDGPKFPDVIYYSDEPRQILDALPRWLRRPVVAYGRFLLRRKRTDGEVE